MSCDEQGQDAQGEAGLELAYVSGVAVELGLGTMVRVGFRGKQLTSGRVVWGRVGWHGSVVGGGEGAASGECVGAGKDLGVRAGMGKVMCARLCMCACLCVCVRRGTCVVVVDEKDREIKRPTWTMAISGDGGSGGKENRGEGARYGGGRKGSVKYARKQMLTVPFRPGARGRAITIVRT